jgi:hypothetical protein
LVLVELDNFTQIEQALHQDQILFFLLLHQQVVVGVVATITTQIQVVRVEVAQVLLLAHLVLLELLIKVLLVVMLR